MILAARQPDQKSRGKKIAGAAQRRNLHGLLIQGSVRPPPIKVAKADWQKAMCDVACERWKAHWFPLEVGTALNERAQVLVREKYSRPEYNQRR